jgi:hypothetical protein
VTLLKLTCEICGGFEISAEEADFWVQSDGYGFVHCDTMQYRRLNKRGLATLIAVGMTTTDQWLYRLTD